MPPEIQSTTAVNKTTHLTGETSKPVEKFLQKGDFKPLPKQHGTFARISEEVVKNKNEIKSTGELIIDNRAILANCTAVQKTAGKFVDHGSSGNWFQDIKQKFHDSSFYKFFKKDVQPALGIQRNADNLTLTPTKGARSGEGSLHIRFNTDNTEQGLIKAKGTETGAEFSVKLGHLQSPKWYQRLGNLIARKTDWGWTQGWRIMTRSERLQEVVKQTTRAAKIASLGITPSERDSFFNNPEVKSNLTEAPKPEENSKTSDWLQTEIKNLRKIVDVAGEYSFTATQLDALKKAEEAVKLDKNVFDDKNGGLNASEKADLETMVLISRTASERAAKNFPSAQKDIDSVIMSSPFLMGPDACLRIATLLESMAVDQERQNKVSEKNVNILENVVKDIGSLSHSAPDSDPAMAGLRKQMAKKNFVPSELRSQAATWRGHAEMKGALYRYQGFLPLLAESTSEELLGALKDQLKSAGIDKGDVDASADSIYKGLTAGSADALIVGLRIQMEENAEPAVKAWVDDKTQKLQENLDKIGDASQFQEASFGDMGVLHEEQIERIEVKNPLDLIKARTNTLDRIVYDSRQLVSELANPSFDVAKMENRQLPNVSSSEIHLDKEVQNALQAQNQQTIKECEALKGSYAILEDLYKPDGALHKQVRSIEDKLTELFKGRQLTAKESKGFYLDPAATEIRALRDEIAHLAPKLAKDHLDHLNSFVDKLDSKAGELKRLNDECISVAQGLAAPSKDFYENKAPDLRVRLENWQERSSNLGLNDLAMFEEGNKAMNEAVQQRVTLLLKDLKSGNEAWNKFSLAIDAIQRCGDTTKGGSIQTLIRQTAEHLQTAHLYGGFGYLDTEWEASRNEITSLADLSKLYQAHKADAPKTAGLQGILNNEVQKARFEGTLRIFALPMPSEIPEKILKDNYGASSDLIRGTNVLNGRLCNDRIANSINHHLDKVATDDPAKRVEAFLDLMNSIQDSDSNRSDDVLRLANTLCPPGSGAKSLGEALGIAEMLLSGKELGKARAEIYKAHIDSRLDTARKNEALRLVLRNPVDNTSLLKKAGEEMPSLKKLGFDAQKFHIPVNPSADIYAQIQANTENFRREFAIADLNSLAGMMKDPAQTYSNLLDPSSADLLAPKIGDNPGTISKECLGLDALYHLAEALSNLQSSPETTMQFKLTMALDRLTANATGDTLTLAQGQENIGEKIQTAFRPQASDPEKFCSLNKEMNALESKKKAHQVECQQQITFAQGAAQSFNANGGGANLEEVSNNPQRKQDALRFAKAMVAAKSLQNWQVDKHGNKTLTREGQQVKAESQSALLKENLENIQNQKDNILKYYDSVQLEAHPEMEKRERRIEYFKNRFRSLNNPFLGFRAGEFGGDFTTDLNTGEYEELQKLYPDIKGGKSALKQTVLKENIFLRENNWQTVGRLAGKGGLNRGIALAGYFSSIDSANLSKNQIQVLGNTYSEFEKTRGELIGKQAELRIQNATRSAILQECLEKQMSPADFAKDHSAKASVSQRLEQWGWDTATYAGRETQVQGELASIANMDLDAVTSKWEQDAGELRGALETLQRQYGQAIADFTARVADLERSLEAASKVGLENLVNNANDLRAANEVRFLRSKLEGIEKNCSASDVFKIASSKIFAGIGNLANDNEEKRKKIDELFQEINDSAAKIENDEAFWHRTSDAFTKQLENAYRIVFDIPDSKKLPPSVDLLIAKDRLDFESIAAGYIDDNLAKDLREIQTRRESLLEKQSSLGRLGVSDFMPQAFSAERTWIKEVRKNSKLTAEIFAKADIREILPALQNHSGEVGAKLAVHQPIAAYLAQAGKIAELLESRALAKGNAEEELAKLDRTIVLGISNLDRLTPKSQRSIIGGDKVLDSLSNQLNTDHKEFVGKLNDRLKAIQAELNFKALKDLQKGYVNADELDDAINRTDWRYDRFQREKNLGGGFIETGEFENSDQEESIALERNDSLSDPGDDELQKSMRGSEFSNSRSSIVQDAIPNSPEQKKEYNPPGVDDLRDTLNSLNDDIGNERFSSDEMAQLTSILSSDQALLDYQSLIMDLANQPQELRQVFSQLIDAQKAKETAFSIAPKNFAPFFKNQKPSNSIKSLSELVKDLKLTKKTSPGDGNCFFHSVSMQVGNIGQQDVRNGIAAKMSELAKLSTDRRGSDFLDDSILTQDAIRRTQTNAAGKQNQQAFWGENYHAIIAAKVYNRPVVVVSPLQVQVIRPDGQVDEGDAQSLKRLKKENPIVLLYNGLNHWDAAVIQ